MNLDFTDPGNSIVALAAVLVFCTIGQSGAADKIIDAAVTNDSLVMSVVSTGCTRQQDFRFDIQPEQSSGITIVTIVRIRADLCRKMPRIVTFRYKLTEIGLRVGEPVTISNFRSLDKTLKCRKPEFIAAKPYRGMTSVNSSLEFPSLSQHLYIASMLTTACASQPRQSSGQLQLSR